MVRAFAIALRKPVEQPRAAGPFIIARAFSP
jgi:hypothetical protein